MAWTTPGTAVAGEVLTAAFWNTNVRDNTNALSRGIVARSQITTSTANSQVMADSGLSVTWTAESDRIYLIVFSGYLTKITNAGYVIIHITDATNTALTIRDYSLGQPEYIGAHVELYQTGLSGSVTRKVRYGASNLNARIEAAANIPAQLYVIDMGLA